MSPQQWEWCEIDADKISVKKKILRYWTNSICDNFKKITWVWMLSYAKICSYVLSMKTWILFFIFLHDQENHSSAYLVFNIKWLNTQRCFYSSTQGFGWISTLVSNAVLTFLFLDFPRHIMNFWPLGPFYSVPNCKLGVQVYLKVYLLLLSLAVSYWRHVEFL